MSIVSFHHIFPDVAKAETRFMNVLRGKANDLPPGTYAFTEAFCVDPDCDCRRVLFNVMSVERRTQVATINHAFDPPKRGAPIEARTFLDPLNPQTDLSESLLLYARKILLTDVAYCQRLVRHYTIVKEACRNPNHPAFALFKDIPWLGTAARQTPVRRVGPKVGPNDRCPCGSGAKYKRCCRTAHAGL